MKVPIKNLNKLQSKFKSKTKKRKLQMIKIKKNKKKIKMIRLTKMIRVSKIMIIMNKSKKMNSRQINSLTITKRK